MKVKPLEWSATYGPGYSGKIGDIVYRFIRISEMLAKPYEYGGTYFVELADAQAAAQKDHDAFISNAVDGDA